MNLYSYKQAYRLPTVPAFSSHRLTSQKRQKSQVMKTSTFIPNLHGGINIITSTFEQKRTINIRRAIINTKTLNSVRGNYQSEDSLSCDVQVD